MPEHISLKEIVFLENDSGDPLNPRGRITDTTDLQASMTAIGQQQPVLVIALNGHYAVIDGHRRVVAARALDWETVLAEIKTDDTDLLAQMLASNVRQNLKPSALGKAIRTLATDKHWGIERVAQLCGQKIDHAQLLVDLLDAPESIRQRVDSGEMSFTAFRIIRDKPRDVQEQVAGLKNPTVRAVRQAVKRDTSAGVLTDMLNQMQPDNTLLVDLAGIRQRLMGDWHSLSAVEKARVHSILQGLIQFIEENSNAHD